MSDIKLRFTGRRFLLVTLGGAVGAAGNHRYAWVSHPLRLHDAFSDATADARERVRKTGAVVHVLDIQTGRNYHPREVYRAADEIGANPS